MNISQAIDVSAKGISSHPKIMNPENDSIAAFLGDECVIQLTREYEKGLTERKNIDIGLNPFALVSDVFQKENFHSDILCALLDPRTKHEEGDKFLRLFFEFLQTQYGVDIDISSYPEATVEREEGRIDVLIKSEKKGCKKRAIIIENKINNAQDTHRQLPDYLDRVTKRDFQCDAIIYLRLNQKLNPSTDGWKDVEINDIQKRLHVINAFDDSEKDLLAGWIQRCENATTNSDAAYIFKHYGTLIKKIGCNAMNTQVMQNFYEIMLKGETFETAKSVKSMLGDLAIFRRDKIIEKFRSNSSPFNKITGGPNNSVLFMGLKFKDANLGFAVYVEEDQYHFLFWDWDRKTNQAELLLKAMGVDVDHDYRNEKGGFAKTFSFPSQEGALYNHIAEFNKKLEQAVKSLEISDPDKQSQPAMAS